MPKSLASTLMVAFRVAFGLLFLLPGLNYFVPMFSEPAEPKAALSLVSAMDATGYMLPLLPPG